MCSVMSNSFVTPVTVAHQAPVSIEFPRQEYWSGLLFHSSGNLPDPGIPLQVDSFTTKPLGSPVLQ